MPVLTNLEARLKRDSLWREDFDRNYTQSESISKKLCLVHVSGNSTRTPFAQLIANPPHEIPTSEASYYYCSDETRKAEDLLGLSRCVYLYAGRAHPSFGKIALAFCVPTEDAHSGSATPFDTGGLANGKIASNLPDSSDSTLRGFCKASEIELREWRKEFARFLAAYFSPVSDYWNGKPLKVDPEEILVRNSDWRARVFEIRFREGQKISDASFWCASKGQMQILEREAKAASPSPTELQRFLENVPSLVPEGTPSYCQELEREVLGRLGYVSPGV